MRVVFFLPDDAALHEAADRFLSKRPRTRRIVWAALGEDRAKALDDALAACDRKHGFAIVDPPRDAENLRLLDRACAARFGKHLLPQAVFFAPRKGAHDDWRASIKPLYDHYHVDRRAKIFEKPAPKGMLKAAKLAAKSDSIVRWGALVPMTFVAGLLVLALLLFRDGLLRSAAVSSLQASFGAKADVAGLVSGFAPSIDLENVAVADRRRPMRNRFEFDRLSAGVELAPLLSGRVHVPELALEGLRFGGERAESGALPEAPPPPPVPEVEPGAAGADFQKAVDELLAKLQPPALEELRTVKEAREMEREARERLERLERAVGESTLPSRIEDARKSVEAVAALQPPASFTDVEAALKELAALRPDPAMLDAVKADLAGVGGLGFDAEKLAIESAKADIESVGATVTKAEGLAEKAKEIKKVGLQDLPKVAALLKDLKDVRDGLKSAGAKVDAARANLAKAQESIASRRQAAESALATSREKLAAARSLLEKSGGDLPARAAALRGSVEKARADLDTMKADLTGRLDGIKATVQAARDEAARLRAELEQALEFARAVPGRLQSAAQGDRDELMKRYGVESLTADGLLKAVFGEQTVEWLRWSLGMVEEIRPMLSRRREKRKKEKQSRLEGTTYSFAVEEPKVPGFWLKRATFSGTLRLDGKPFRLEGRAENLASDLAAAGSDAVVEFTAEHEGRRLTAKFRMTPAGEATLDVAAEGFDLSGSAGGKLLSVAVDGGGLGVRVSAAFGRGTARATASVSVKGLRVALDPARLDSRLAFLRVVCSDVTAMTAAVDLAYASGSIDSFRVTSDVGATLTASLKRALAGQVEDAKREALARLDEQLAGPRREAEAAATKLLGGEENVRKLLSTVTGGTDGVDAAAKLAGGRADGFARLLDVGADPSGAIEEARKAIESLTAQSNGLDGKPAAAAADPLEAAAAAAKLSEEKTAKLKEVEAAIKAEIERVSGLR